MPAPTIPSGETGTRHRTAERVAKQTGAKKRVLIASFDLDNKGEKDGKRVEKAMVTMYFNGKKVGRAVSVSAQDRRLVPRRTTADLTPP